MISLFNRVRTRLRRELLKAVLNVSRRADLKRLGSDYGGWVVPTSLISSSSVCYCAGVGEDVTFDIELIEELGCNVFAFDPTPRAIEYVEENAKDVPNFHFYDVGLWSTNERLKFFAPKDPGHVSHSIVNLQSTSEFFEAECKRLSSLMDDLGHDSLDLLKLDIEGAEYEVVNSMLEDQVPVKVLCVEFDQPTSFASVLRMVRKLKRSKYNLVNIENWNYTFVREDY